MPIYPLPQYEADVKAALVEEDRKVYEALKAPKTMVVRFGAMKMVGEFPYSGTIKPGCGSKIVVRTFRGTEIGEMLTSTCPNSGCSKSVSRKEMLGYIQNSGGRDYPFSTDGRVLRIADGGDLEAQTRIEQSAHAIKMEARRVVERLNIPVKIADAEPILGGETLTIYYMSEERAELRDLVRELSYALKARVELRHVGARDEARLTADYEKCGQYCCCKNFLKVLKPVSMKSAKVQKATLDPLKISGRCGRLMCCLRYEDATYEELRKKLPRRKSRVGTPDGDGMVIDSQILTQLVLVLLDNPAPDGKPQEVAVAVEDLSEPISAHAPPPRPTSEGPPPARPQREGRRSFPERAPTPRPRTDQRAADQDQDQDQDPDVEFGPMDDGPPVDRAPSPPPARDGRPQGSGRPSSPQPPRDQRPPQRQPGTQPPQPGPHTRPPKTDQRPPHPPHPQRPQRPQGPMNQSPANQGPANQSGKDESGSERGPESSGPGGGPGGGKRRRRRGRRQGGGGGGGPAPSGPPGA